MKRVRFTEERGNPAANSVEHFYDLLSSLPPNGTVIGSARG
jgi:hypothetical protein